ncbi:transient receptor potential cation channel subfamily M member 5-like [Acanthaster planci]|uniref:Transient receptor potential cation channel subfamily M member 5-like n=1 Tax=Acanthaster planci TaxID=133434 RepID=A0A8B7XX24_ACAPL|nr:transient receptor potential cation channel subfamily M member 5-like [Acanthaster planci]
MSRRTQSLPERIINDGRDDPDRPGIPTLHQINDFISAIPSRLLQNASPPRSPVRQSDIEMNRTSSDAEGESAKESSPCVIKFDGLEGNVDVKYRKCVMTSSSGSSNDILDTLTDKLKWALKLPKLLICILGGEDAVMMYDQEQEICKGLVKTVLSNDVWLLTSGLQCGLMKSIGEALTEHAAGHALSMRKNLVAIGVAPLGILQHKEEFRPDNPIKLRQRRKHVTQKCMPVIELDYTVTDDQSGNRLDPNHTHFILVGDKEQGKGTEGKLRSQLVNKIKSWKIEGTTDSHSRTPTVYLLFGGNATVFETLLDAVRNNIPIIVFPESKGAAEVLVDVIQMDDQRYAPGENFHNGVKKLLKEKLKLRTMEEVIDIKVKIQRTIYNHRHLINIEPVSQCLNSAILRALMKAEQHVEHQSSQLMRLAVLWNLLDLAKSKFEKTNPIWKQTDLMEELLHYTLVNDQPDFVKLFITAGRINMKEFLTFARLKELYNKAGDNTVVLTILERYTEKTASPEDYLAGIESLLKKLMCDTYDADLKPKTGKNTFKEPLKELFVWSVLQDRIPMAMVFWKLGKPSVGGVLVANKLLKALSEHQQVVDAQRAAEIRQHSRDFEEMAVDILKMCYASDRRRTSSLLVRIMPEWGGVTCLDIAASAKSKRFISHVAVQNLLSELWMGRMFVMTHVLKIGLCVVLPFLSMWLITFPDHVDASSVQLKKKKDPVFPPAASKMDGAKKDQADGITQVYTFDLPQSLVQWMYNIDPIGISQLLFLALFSYIVLANFNQEVSVFEIVLMVWVFSIFTEEIRQIQQEECNTFLHRVRAWLWGYWNCVDLISLVMFAVGIGLRFHPATFDAARVVLALDLMVFYFRILHVCSASKHLGPKLIMITKMMLDLISFICILLVFLIAYGVACQAILYPNSAHPESIAKGVLYRSYFQLYGELFLDSFESQCAVNETQLAAESWFATVSLAIYLFISNILLLNLLIAMLNYTFTAVQENTDTYWKFQRYQLIKEYYRRPAVVPPFIVVAHLFQLVRYVWDRCCPKHKMYRVPNLMRRKMKREVAEMVAWEKGKCQDYLAEQKAVNATKMKMEHIEKRLEDISSKMNQYFDGNSLSESLNTLLKQLDLSYNNPSPYRTRSPDSLSVSFSQIQEMNAQLDFIGSRTSSIQHPVHASSPRMILVPPRSPPRRNDGLRFESRAPRS